MRRKLNLPIEVLAFHTWPAVPPEVVPQNKRACFERRVKACELYCSGELSAREVARRVGLSAPEVTRLVHSALRSHPDGEIYGQRALVPYKHEGDYERAAVTESGTAGLFTQLLSRFPDVRAEIVQAYCKQGKRLKDIHRQMLQSLALRGVGTSQYPFNTERRGLVALGEFCRGLAGRYFQAIAEIRHGHPAGRRAKSPQVGTFVRDILRPYSRVEVDAHRLDAIFVLRMTGADGVERKVTLRRLLIVVLLDVASRAVLGHVLSLNHTESRLDVLAAIERALSDAPPLPITEPGLACRADSGLPVHILPNCTFRAIDEFAFDNSRTACSRSLQETLIHHLQARINLGESDKPEGRAFVESFFKKLTENGCQRLPSSTGGSPDSPKRRHPEVKAHRYELTLEAAEQILEVIVREYNNTPHGSLSGTPLDYIRAWDASGRLSRRLPLEARGLDFLYEQKLVLTVRGGVASGTRPYVQYKGARYRNTQLAHHGKLVGSKIIGILDRRNIAVIRAFLDSGEPLGVLTAQGRWGLSPHSLKTRQAILMLERSGELASIAADPIESYLAKLTERARTHRAAANELARVRRERGEIQENGSAPGPSGSTPAPRAESSSTSTLPPPASTVLQAPDREPHPIATSGAVSPRTRYELSLGAGVVIQRKERH